MQDSKNNKKLIEINIFSLVSDLKEIIRKKGIIKYDQFEIIYNGMILEDDDTIEKCEIEDLSSVFVIGMFAG